ncbi:UNVERIFIED_CONTAM: hypothetical protein OHV15_07890 [Microbacterium sp. SLM126]
MADFTPRRSSAIRANLINHVAETVAPRRRRVLWTVGLVLAGTLAGAAASAGALANTERVVPVRVQPPAPGYGTLPEYRLELQHEGADVAQPKDPHAILDLLGLDAGKLRQYEGFRQLKVWSGESRFGTTCLLVAHPLQGLQEGIGDAQCSAEGIDTIADLTLCGSCTAGGTFAGLPIGSLIRFVLQGDHVDVYMYVPVDDPIRWEPPED